MFLFIRLLLAHLIGDYPLQINRIHALKFKGLKGNIPHILIVMGCFILLSLPFLHLPLMWLLILFIGVTHLFQDFGKIQLGKVSKHNFLFYLLDQIMHAAAISFIFLTNLKNIGPIKENNPIAAIYNNDFLVLFIIAVIAASYNGHYMIILFKKDYLKKDSKYTPFEKWYGFAERTIMVALAFIGNILFFAIPIIPFLRYIVYRIKKDKTTEQFKSITEIALSGIIGLICALIVLLI